MCFFLYIRVEQAAVLTAYEPANAKHSPYFAALLENKLVTNLRKSSPCSPVARMLLLASSTKIAGMAVTL